MSEALEVQSPKCVSTDFLGRICERCCNNIDHMRPNAQYCSRTCQKHAVRESDTLVRVRLRNLAYQRLNRDRGFTFDGRYEGPLTNPITIVNVKRKDTGYVPADYSTPCPVDAPKFTQVTPDDVDWALKQKGVSHALPMPRPLSNYCVCCREAVIDGTKEVRVTKGCYLPVEHDCPRTRVYDLHGKLLEVI